jgi:hypothetical protein
VNLNDPRLTRNVIPFPTVLPTPLSPAVPLARGTDQLIALDLLRRSILLNAVVLSREPSLDAQELVTAKDLVEQVARFLESIGPPSPVNS